MGQKRVLIVDDDEMVSGVLVALTRRLLPDHQIVAAKDGVAAVAELRKQPFDLILTDYDMPRMNGLDLARVARRISPGVPVVLITGSYSYREDLDETGSAPLAGFLAKPFSMTELREAFQQGGV